MRSGFLRSSVLVALAGCATDYRLREVFGDDADDGGGGADGDPGWGDDDDDPWGQVDPGNLPEVYFVIAWADYNVRASYVDDAEMWAETWGTHYSVVDLKGQEILRFEAPDDTIVSHAALEPVGPGVFQATVTAWPVDGDGTVLADPSWQVWRADALAQTFTPALWLDPTRGAVVVESTGDVVEIGDPNHLVSAAAFASAPHKVWVWASPSPCTGTALEPLRGVSTWMKHAPVASWAPDRLLPDDVVTQGGYVSMFEAATGTDGVDRGLLGLYRQLCYDAYDPKLTLTAFEKPGGPLWSYELPIGGWPVIGDVRFSAEEGGRGLWVSSDELGKGSWNLASAEGVRTGPLDDKFYGYRTGPLLWADTGTFAVVGGLADGSGDAVVLYHKGKRVWTLDTFKFGVEKKKIWIQDVIVLPPV